VISTLSGTIASLGADSCTIEVGGVGLHVHLTPRHILKLRTGDKTSIDTRLVVREDELSLFGFQSSQEREQFDLLCSVSGIGPKLAMTTIAGMDAVGIANAVNNQDEAAFRAIPGIGPKTAKLILISLGGKVGLSAATPEKERVLQALLQLGTEESQARKVLTEIDGSLGESEALRAALAELGKGKLK
jgi:Holliday junction DNA helicase RuvA